MQGTPHRDTNLEAGPCAHCGDQAWVDLTEDDATRTLAAIESYELETIDPNRRAREWMLRIGGAVLMSNLCYFAATASSDHLGAGFFQIMMIVVGVIAVLYFALGLGRARRIERRELPYRWSLPLSPTATPAKGGHTVQGSVSARGDEPLTAPLTGRPCLAHVVVARRVDAPGNAPLGLVVQDSVDLVVDGHTIEHDAMRLDSPTQPITIDPARKATVSAFLRCHGILNTEHQWELAEAILEPGTVVRAQAATPHGFIVTPARV
ncbi:MAG: hypothetical protein K0V04_17900 [Deltaproteobacteria bacterium]|nr:hypothetical protein [Deltaproteobacteria bacterium]